jgi:branched-chain amino acid transport system substrate-binding protein
MAERLIIEDQVHVLTAPFGSGHTQIVAGIGERYQIPVIASVASSESVYDQGFEYLFGTLAPNEGITRSLIGYVGEHFPEVQRVAVLGRDDVFPRAMAVDFATDAEAAGLEIVYNELYAVGTMEHSAALSRIASLQPDWVYMTGYTQDLITLRTQMRNLGLTAPVVTMITGPAYAEFIEGLGEAANGITSASWWHHNAEYEADDVFGTTSAFYQQYVEEHGHDPDYVHASAAAALIVLEKAIEAAGSLDGAAIRDALEATDIVTFYGPVRFREDGMNEVRDLPLIQVQNQQVEVLNPPDIATAVIIPMPDWEG